MPKQNQDPFLTSNIGLASYLHALGGKIIDIDKINPQMASGLAGSFKIYKKLNVGNKKVMKVELERVVSTQSISKNVYEIVSKIIKS